MHVLVHIDLDQGLGPIGAWANTPHGLRHFYPESLDTAISARARNLMAQRTLDTPVEDWMHLIAETNPTPLDTWEVIETNPNVTLPTILAEYRRTWIATSSD